MTPPMHQITLNDLIQVLVAGRNRIIAITGLFLLLSIIIALLLPNTYVARALVLFSEPQFEFRFEDRQFQKRFLDSDVYLSTNNALVGIALSDDVLQATLATIELPPEAGDEPLEYLKDRVAANLDFGNSLVVLSMWDRDPQLVAHLTNAWMDVFIERANRIFGSGTAELERLQLELVTVSQTRQTAENALTAFRTRDNRSTLGARLDASRTRYQNYQQQLETIALLQLDINSFRAQLNQRPESGRIGLGDIYVAMRLQGAIQNVQNAPTPSLQLELTNVILGDIETNMDLITFLEELHLSLNERQQAIEPMLDDLQNTIQTLQTDIETLGIENANLVQDLDLARLAYYRVQRQLEEARIADSVVNDYVQVSSRAVPPTQPSDLPGWLLVGVASIIGLFTSVGIVFLQAYWQLLQTTEQTS